MATLQAIWSLLFRRGAILGVSCTLIELIDVTFYHCGYRAAFLVLFNKLSKALDETKKLPFSVKALGYFPLALALLDATEDSFQVATTLLYDLNNDAGGTTLFNVLASCASFFNQVKWRAVSVGMPLFALSGISLGAIKLVKRISALRNVPTKPASER